MGEENKNVKKPAVSNAVVKKKNGGNRNKKHWRYTSGQWN